MNCRVRPRISELSVSFIMASLGHYFDVESKWIHADKKPVDLDANGIGFVLFERMTQFANLHRFAQIDAVTGHKDSFQHLLKRSIRVAISLRNFGIQPGDVIGICSSNHINSIVPYIAGCFLGAIVAPTDPTISMDDQRHLLNLVKPKIIFVSAGREDMISDALSRLDFACSIISFALTNKYTSFASFIEKQEGEEGFEPVMIQDPTTTCVVLFSSGTTGLPKGICLSHYFILNICASVTHLVQLKPVFMLYSTLYWISAVGFSTMCLYYGFERVICREFDPLMMWEHIDAYNVSAIFLAPVHVIQSLQCLEKRVSTPTSLKVLIIGGSAMAPNYLAKLRKLLPTCTVSSGYGQTETGFISTFKQSQSDDNCNKLDSVGYLLSNLIAKVVNPDTEQVLDLNQQGEIRIKTAHAMNGYYNQDSSMVWDAQGFVKTGDMGYFDNDLCLYLTDRIKEMFKYMSWHIVPAKLEAILQSHPDVELAIVVGIPHPTEDNHAVGAVTLQPNATVGSNELEKFVAERVDERNRLRAGVVILQSMPLTPTGKIMRRKIKEMLKKIVTLRE